MLLQPSEVTPLYEQDDLFLVTGGTLRPGGIALTTEICVAAIRNPVQKSWMWAADPGRTVELMSSRFWPEADRA